MESCSSSTKFLYHALSLSLVTGPTESGNAVTSAECITVDNLAPVGNQRYQQFYQQMPKHNNQFIKQLSCTLQHCEDACDGDTLCIGFTRGISAPAGGLSICYLYARKSVPSLVSQPLASFYLKPGELVPPHPDRPPAPTVGFATCRANSSAQQFEFEASTVRLSWLPCVAPQAPAKCQISTIAHFASVHIFLCRGGCG